MFVRQASHDRLYKPRNPKSLFRLRFEVGEALPNNTFHGHLITPHLLWVHVCQAADPVNQATERMTT